MFRPAGQVAKPLKVLVVPGVCVAGRKALTYPRESHTQARITQVLPPKRWHCWLATFCAWASEAALAQPLGPQVFLASIANAAQVLAKLVTTLQLSLIHI